MKHPGWMLAAILCGGLAGCRHEPVRVYPGASPGTATAGYPPESRGAENTGDSVRPGLTAPMPEVPPGARAISTEVGLASWYGTVYDHRRAADGTVYDQDAMTAASRTVPLGALARVTNLATGEIAVVRITDRGPFVPGRILDLSLGAAKAAGLYRAGVGRVRVEAYLPDGKAEAPGKWCVQIGAFLDPDDAQQMKNDLARRYGGAKVIAFTGPTGSWVRLTPAASDRQQSAAVAAEVKVPDPGVGAYVTRLN